MEYVELNNGVQMPVIGFGVYEIPEGEMTQIAVENAIDVGYRLIDTAAVYLNEEGVGKAIAKKIADGTVKREDLFITTKLWVQDAGYEATKKAFDVSLKKLNLDYLDLYLIHEPMGDYYGSWRAMEELYQAGKIRAIGVSNFYPTVLADLCIHNKIRPAVNQVEIHPHHNQEKAIETMKKYGVTPEAWSPLATGERGIFNNPVLVKIGGKYGKTTAQVILRWHLQRGIVTIPKSTHKERMEENFSIFDFTLSDEDMAEISTIEKTQGNFFDLLDVETVEEYSAEKIHD